MNLSSSILIFALFSSLVSAQGLPGTWPTPDTPAPPNATWTEAVRRLNGRDATIVQSCPSQNDWALTYDDGPSEVTNTVLNELAKTNAKATFFVVGSRIIQNPSILKRAFEAGHQIALHSWSHADFGTLTEEQIIADVMWDMKAVYDVIGVYPKYFRVPFGSSSATVLRVLGKFGLTMVSWNRDTNDWRAVDDRNFNINWVAGNFTQWVNERLSTGTISLQHDLFALTTGPVPATLNTLNQARYNLKTVANCLGDGNAYTRTNPVVEAAGAQGAGPAGGAPVSGGNNVVKNNTSNSNSRSSNDAHYVKPFHSIAATSSLAMFSLMLFF